MEMPLTAGIYRVLYEDSDPAKRWPTHAGPQTERDF